MNVVSLPPQCPIPAWAEFLPELIPQLVSRLRDRDDARALGAEIHGAIRTLSGDRYRRMAEYFAASRTDALQLIALVLAASWDAGEPADMLYALLTEDERAQVLTLAAEFGDLLPADAGERPLAVEPIAYGLAAAAAPVSMSQKPGSYRFRVVLPGGDAQVEVRLGGGPMELRQISGPSLMLAERETPLPSREMLPVQLDEGRDVADWLRTALCWSGDDAR